MISFWRDGLPNLYIEKSSWGEHKIMTLTQEDLVQMLEYIKHNLPEVWSDAVEDDVSDAYNDGLNTTRY
ncbi:hypothetical protein UFOVP59_32 [uncultured Caudovirales phage]|uniref:Uncharacterized protein n=1 Tax=uncultured Caudovirales phage TaxID=2100421 RepID=A0A6J5KQG3_9CAUD|nr:hypothetical protein UFOVP59_32 [uncultured Caudovirales phage]CAB5221102.1 hypothetical protein UFOVP246_83 [uncultured Caudovirales phage]